MEKIDIKELWKGNEQFDVQKIVYLAEKINEAIREIEIIKRLTNIEVEVEQVKAKL